MKIQFSTLFCVCIVLAIPLLVLSTSNDEQLEEEMVSNLRHHDQQPFHAILYDDDVNNRDHFILKKAADLEQILKPCNRMPASGRGHEYADCVRNRMLLMGRRKRRNAN
jgi:hypothetical protein